MIRTLNRFLPNYGAEERRSSDALGFFQTFVERRAKWTGAAANLAGYRENGVECPRRAFLQRFIRVICGIEARDKVMAAGKETGSGSVCHERVV